MLTVCLRDSCIGKISIVLFSNKRYFQALRDNCLKGGGVGKLERRTGENDNKREGVGCKI